MPRRLVVLVALVALLVAAVSIPGTPNQTAAQTTPTQIALAAGTSLVPYLGPTLDVEAALTNIATDLSAVWEFESGVETWSLWSPALPDALQGFADLIFGRAYFVTISQAATWEFAAGDLPPAPASANLAAGGNAIVHFGDAQSIDDALNADAVWSLTSDVWTSYVSGLPSALQSFTTLEPESAYFIFVPSDAELVFAAGQPASAAIGPEGGVLVSTDGRFTLTVPSGALEETVELTIVPQDVAAPARLQSSQISENLAPLASITIGPAGIDFFEPAEVSLELGPTDLPAGGIPLIPVTLDGTPVGGFANTSDQPGGSPWSDSPRTGAWIPHTGDISFFPSIATVDRPSDSIAVTQNVPFRIEADLRLGEEGLFPDEDTVLEITGGTAGLSDSPDGSIQGIGGAPIPPLGGPLFGEQPVDTVVDFFGVCRTPIGEPVPPILGVMEMDWIINVDGDGATHTITFPLPLDSCDAPPGTLTFLDPVTFEEFSAWPLDPGGIPTTVHLVANLPGLGVEVAAESAAVWATWVRFADQTGPPAFHSAIIADGPEDTGGPDRASGDFTPPADSVCLPGSPFDEQGPTDGNTFLVVTQLPRGASPSGDFDGNGAIDFSDLGVVAAAITDTSAFATCP